MFTGLQQQTAHFMFWKVLGQQMACLTGMPGGRRREATENDLVSV